MGQGRTVKSWVFTAAGKGLGCFTIGFGKSFKCLLMASCGQPEMLSELTMCVSTVTVLLNASLYYHLLSGKKLKPKHSSK